MRPRSHKHLVSLLSLSFFASLALPLFLCLMKEAGWSPAGLNDGLMDVRFKLGNHSFYMVTSITAATNITSHTSLSLKTLWVSECVKKCSECVLDSLMEGPGSVFDGHLKESHFESGLCIV